MSAVRREVEALQQALHRSRQVADAAGLYAGTRHDGYSAAWATRVKALRHELDTLAAIATRLEKATAPRRQVPQLRLPAPGSVRQVVLEVLHADALGHDHDHLRELVGLTDAELAARITGAELNSVRPRRLDLVRGGWVEAAGMAGNATRWTLTDAGRQAMDKLVASDG